MRKTYDNGKYEVVLQDDGTLDTVVSVNGIVFRFNDCDWESDTERIKDCFERALEAYIEEVENA